jgi:hypothetical protein
MPAKWPSNTFLRLLSSSLIASLFLRRKFAFAIVFSSLVLSSMASEFWAITAYFNPMHWPRRLANYRAFRSRVQIPLVAVELGYDGQYDLKSGDADILIQIPGTDVMWQKERLFNVALAHVPFTIQNIACLDSDIYLQRDDVWHEAARALDHFPIIQLYSEVFYLDRDFPLDFHLMRAALPACPGFSCLQSQGHTPLELCNPAWTNPADLPPVTYGLAWAFRRELFAKRGFYDSWIVGGGTRVHFFAAHGHYAEASAAFQFQSAMHEHYCAWAQEFYAAVRGQWGYIPGQIAHLWHGDLSRRKHRRRYREFAQHQFDPTTDIVVDARGAWRFGSDKPAMHQYLREYISSRERDELSDIAQFAPSGHDRPVGNL